MRRTIVLLVIAAAAVVVLGGCSGAGAPAVEVQGATVQTLAVDQLSAVTLFKAWSDIMYYIPGTGSTEEGNETTADGLYYHSWGHESDGAHFDWYFPLDTDHGSHGTLTWPDGSSFTQVCDPTQWSADWSTSRDHFVSTYRDGTKLEVTVEAQYGVHNHSSWHGSLTPAGRPALIFDLDRMEAEQDVLTVSLADGSKLEATVPLALSTGWWPDFPKGATGSYTNSGGAKSSFVLAGDVRWQKWDTATPNGLAGSFALNADFQGTGSVRDGASVAGALRWDGEVAGVLDLLGSGQMQVSPSAASLEFAAGTWLHNLGVLMPAPCY